MIHELPDGDLVVLRFIAPTDRALLARGLEQLSPQSRRQRFLVPKSRLSDVELDYLTDVDGHDHVAIVAVLAADPTQLVGVGRFVRHPERREEAELAITVGDPWQGMGLGRTIGLALADIAKAAGIRRFTASLLGTNIAAHRLFHAISRRVRTQYAAGIADLVVELETREHPVVPSALVA
jgi:acetyltransferase